MGCFVRMLEKQKWENNNLVDLGYNETPADTITGDLRTVSNKLSLWLIDSLDVLNDAILALALMRNKLTRLDIIMIDRIKIEQKGLEVLNTPENGKTPLINFDEYHYDVINLTYDKLGIFSQIIIDDVTNEEKCLRYTKGEISELLFEGYMNNRFKIDCLNEGLIKDLQKVIERKTT